MISRIILRCLFLTVIFSKFYHLEKGCILKRDYTNACKPNQKFEFAQNKLNGCILAVVFGILGFDKLFLQPALKVT